MRSPRATLGKRCDMIDVQPYGSRRCVYQSNHFPKCRFAEDGDQEICGRTSVNFTERTIRTCSLTANHDPPCVYLWLTERPATAEEMRVPEEVIPK